MKVGATLHPGSNPVAAALAGEFNVVLDTVELATGPGGQIPNQGRLYALEIVGSRIRWMKNVHQVVSIGFREVHRDAVFQPRDIAHRGALHPAHDANVRRIVHVAVIREELLDKRWRRY